MSKKSIEERRKDRKKKRQSNTAEDHQKAKNWAKEWVDAIIFAGIAALFIRAFFFGAYRIPTPSMENSLMTGDFLMVSKMHYGARTPMSIGIPLTQIYIPGLELPWFRLPGFTNVERNDIVVFNYPIDEGIADQKTNYVKRCVAVPGDKVYLEDGNLFINDEPAYHGETFLRFYEVKVNERIRLSNAKVENIGGKIRSIQNDNIYLVNMTEAQAETIKTWAEVESVRGWALPKSSDQFSQSRFNFSRGTEGNHHQMEPFTVPEKGETVILTNENWHLYQDIVERYEENQVQRTSNGFRINGEFTTSYTFKKDYYFMMGDNRDDSEDSRFWGFVPDDHIVGTPAVVYFSWDKDRFLPRFSRLFFLPN